MELKKKIKVNAVLMLLFLITICFYVYASVPTGPTVTIVSNTTKGSASSGTLVNGTGGNTNQSGGYIYTINLAGESQNNNWKAFVGNVTGTLVLDDASGYSIYRWTTTTSPAGQVYATRQSSTITWANINCSTTTNISNEETNLNQNSSDDNITTTFDGTDNDQFTVGTVTITANTCPTTHTYVNDTAQSTEYEEILLHDGTNTVYTTIIENNGWGYHTNTIYDFQMLVPENASDSWEGSTPYYFYVELT